MNRLWIVARQDLRESLRSQWFTVYTLVFGGMVALMFILGVTESQVLGFLGLGRLLVTFIQLCIAILPIFVLMTTVRSIVGDRESHVLEYWLSFPLSLGDYYWGKFCGRFLVTFLPVFGAMAAAALWGAFQGIEVPWHTFGLYAALLVALCGCFLGLGFLLSVLTRHQEVALSLALILWLLLLAFLDVILIGVMLQEHVPPTAVVAVALANPLQSFRTAALLLFDPQLSVLGPTAYIILDHFGRTGFLFFALFWPLLLGAGAAALGYRLFRRWDMI
ncbi:MAG: ABC transporter permease subunit [Magnetococcales bacterium]|nr:ABC transporter permease subunit [Magnetococcales bacterium]